MMATVRPMTSSRDVLDLAEPAALLGHPARSAIVLTLMGGRSVPATELARAARIRPSTASEHLARLLDGGLVAVDRRGRHRYYRLAGPHVAEAIEAFGAITDRAPSVPRPDVLPELALVRSCYRHVAGRIAVALAQGAVGDDLGLTARGKDRIEQIGVDLNGLAAADRSPIRTCNDWTERRPHIGGAVGAAVLAALLERGWLVRIQRTRALRVTAVGRAELGAVLDVRIDDLLG